MLTIIMNILAKRITAAAGMIILTNITNMSILTRTVTAAAVTIIPTSIIMNILIHTKTVIAAADTTIPTRIIMNTANAAVTKRRSRRTITRTTKIFCTTEKICPTS